MKKKRSAQNKLVPIVLQLSNLILQWAKRTYRFVKASLCACIWSEDPDTAYVVFISIKLPHYLSIVRSAFPTQCLLLKIWTGGKKTMATAKRVGSVQWAVKLQFIFDFIFTVCQHEPEMIILQSVHQLKWKAVRWEYEERGMLTGLMGPQNRDFIPEIQTTELSLKVLLLKLIFTAVWGYDC